MLTIVHVIVITAYPTSCQLRSVGISVYDLVPICQRTRFFVDGEGIEPSSVLRLRVKDYSSPCTAILATLSRAYHHPPRSLRPRQAFLRCHSRGAAKHPFVPSVALSRHA